MIPSVPSESKETKTWGKLENALSFITITLSQICICDELSN